MTQQPPQPTCYLNALARACALTCAAVLAWTAAGTHAQPLVEAPPGLVSADSLKKREAELSQTRKDLDAAQKNLAKLQGQLKQAQSQPKPQAPPDPLTAAQLQQAQAELNRAHARVKLQETQLATLERQRDDALAAAKAAALRAATAGKADPDAAVRRERDRLKAALDEQERTNTQLRVELQRTQQEASRLRQAAQATPTAAPPATAPIAVAPSRAPASAAVQAQTVGAGRELTVPGCGEKCPTFILLPQTSKVTMGVGSEARTVDFEYRLAMGKTEITVAQWRHFLIDSGFSVLVLGASDCLWSNAAWSERHPVVCVSAAEADAYVAWFNSKYASQLGMPRLRVTLPTELEWEFAARAGRWTQERQWDSGIKGGRENCDFALSTNCGGYGSPDPFAKPGRQPNAWGLFDMIGNVEEWTSTWANGEGRVSRGGSGHYPDYDQRFSNRSSRIVGARYRSLGFRVSARSY